MKIYRVARLVSRTSAKFAKKKDKATAPDITAKTITDKLTQKEVINMKSLDTVTRNEVTRLTKELQGAVTDFGMSGLKIGKVLKDIHTLLDPRGQFTPYLNSLPGFSVATAYRYMSAYEGAIANMPKNILNTVIAAGLPMLGTGDKPYGKYSDVIKKHPMPKDPSDEEAQQYIAEVQAEYSKTRKKGGAKVPNPDALKYEAFTSVLKKYSKVPDNAKQYWIKQLFSYVLGNLGMDGVWEITPKKPPASWVSAKGTDTKEEEEDETTE